VLFIHGNHAARRENGSSWWGCLCGVCFASKKSSEREFFIPAGTHLGVKLLTSLPLWAQIWGQLFNELRVRLTA